VTLGRSPYRTLRKRFCDDPNEEIKRRTIVERIFPNEDSCLCLIRSLSVATNEDWLKAYRYIDMKDLKGIKKVDLRQAAQPACSTAFGRTCRAQLKRLTWGATMQSA
jgi:hypothetical protein